MRRWLGLVAIAACLAPTEINLDITTNVDCSQIVATRIAVGMSGSDASIDDIQTKQCTGGEIGTLTVARGSGQEPIVAIEVAAAIGISIDACQPPYTIDAGPGVGCIVARRSLKYSVHAPLYLPIALDSDCLNVPCTSDQTCVQARCVPSTVDPNSCGMDAGCQLIDAGAPDASSATPVALTIGDNHACALMSDGTIRCWGDNSKGQLGSAGAGAFSPVAVQVDTIQDATAVSAGASTTCALRASGEVWCWGDDTNGAVDGKLQPTVDRPTPTTATVTGASLLAVGGSFTCAVVTGDGGSYPTCWGALPKAPAVPPAFNDVVTTYAVTHLACGTDGCVGMAAKAGVWFGLQTDGELDNQTNANTYNVSINSLSEPMAGVGMGTDFGCSYGATTGSVSCWGNNTQGECGVAPGTYQNLAQVPNVTGVTSVGVGGSHACVVSAQRLLCWGQNTHGELGVGDLVAHTGPQGVGLTGAVDEVAAGTTATCARQGAVVTCWGNPVVIGDGTMFTLPRALPGAAVVF